MALKGTIKDFGVADIFQLIGQQAKTGVLVFSNDVDEVRVFFIQGAVVRAQEALRTAELMVGSLMVRAQVVSRERLDAALEEQQRTLKRLVDILVERGVVTPEDVLDFAKLQLTETVYRLFSWKFGTYEFESQHVEPPPDGLLPIRAESIVMNGVRMMDEWPAIRERIPSYGWFVERMRPLPIKEIIAPKEEFDFSSLTEELGGESEGPICEFERRIYGLIVPSRSVQNLIDYSRIGEFEALSALSTLMTEGYVRVIKPEEHRTEVSRAKLTWARRAREASVTLARVAISATLVGGAFLLFARVSALDDQVEWASSSLDGHRAAAQEKVLYRSLEIFRYRNGRYPMRLEELVESGLVSPRDLSYPFEGRYDYVVEDGRAALFRPIR